VTFKEDIDMLNPHSEMITDECSGIEVTNQRYIDWEAGAKAARDEILELVKEEYPLIVTWPAWKRFTGERIV